MALLSLLTDYKNLTNITNEPCFQVLYCVVYCLTFKIVHQFSLPGFGGQMLSKLVDKLGFSQSNKPKINPISDTAVKPISLRIHPVQGMVKDYVYSAQRRVKRNARPPRKYNSSVILLKTDHANRRSRKSRTVEEFAPTENYSEFRKHVFELMEELFPPPTISTTPEPTFSKVDFPPNSLDMEMGDKFFDRRLRKMEHGPWKPEYDDFYDWFYLIFDDVYRFRRRQFAAKNYTGTIDYNRALQSTPFKIPTAYKSYYAHVRELERIYNIHPFDPPDIVSEMLDSGWNFNESALEYLGTSEEERFMKKTVTPPRTFSWEDSESELKREAKFCFPKKYNPIYRPFYQWFFEILTTVRRKGKKANANLTLDHIDIMDSGNREEEMKNTPFPIPADYAVFYPHFKKLKLAFDGVLAKHNDTHFTVVETPSTKKIRKSTPIPAWKFATILSPRNESSIESYADGRSIQKLRPFFTVRSGRKHSLRTMTWEDKIKARLWVMKAQRYKRGKTPTTPSDRNPLYSRFYVWHREALKFVGANVAKINFETEYSRVPKYMSTPFPVPKDRTGFYYVISDYIKQVHDKNAHTNYTNRWRP